jgi:acyl-CoA synthetase (NDP forming)
VADPRLRALLAPRSVALVGASDDASRPAGRPLAYLRRDGFTGRVYPVNPRRDSVQGVPTWPSLGDLPEVPEHVFVLTGVDAVVGVVRECSRLGVPAATVLSDGFAEAGGAGASRLRDLLDAAAGRVRLLGPNSIGLVDTRSGLTLTANAAFAEGDLPTGRAFVASQSGSLIGALMSRGGARGIGFAGAVSVGGECDVTIGELCSATLDDPGIDSYVLFLENLSHSEDLRSFALAAADAGRPILAYKLGRSAAGADLSVTHTGAIAGDDAVAAAFLADCGIARVDTLEGLLEGSLLSPMLPTGSSSAIPRVGVVTATGGGAAMVVDQLGARGIDVAQPSDATHSQLVERVGREVFRSRIVDLTLRGTGVAPMTAAIDVLRHSNEYDLVVQIIGSSAASHPEMATEPARASPRGDVPLAVFVVPEAAEALRMLAAAGIPAFRTPEACADAAAALLGRRAPRRLPPGSAPSGTHATEEDAAARLLAELGIAEPPSITLDADQSIGRLPFGYPIVAKADLIGLAHKSDVGGVVLDIRDERSLRQAIDTLVRSTGTERILVQAQLDPVAEVLVGYRRDPSVGPLVVLSAGGALAELSDRPAIRLAPVDHPTALAMISELPALQRLLAGYRGRPAGDVGALVETVVRLSQLATRANVAEAEINPVIVTAHDAVAVDFLIRLDRR